MNAVPQPRAGSSIDRAMQMIRAAGRPLSLPALAVALDQIEGEVPALLRYGVRVGLLVIEQRDGVDWYDLGQGVPLQEPVAPPPPPPAPPVPVVRITPAPEAPAPRPRAAPRAPLPHVARERVAQRRAEPESEGVDMDAVHRRYDVLALEPAAEPAPAASPPTPVLHTTAAGFLQLMDMEVVNAQAALVLAQIRLERLVELQAEARAAEVPD